MNEINRGGLYGKEIQGGGISDPADEKRGERTWPARENTLFRKNRVQDVLKKKKTSSQTLVERAEPERGNLRSSLHLKIKKGRKTEEKGLYHHKQTEYFR